MRKLIDIEPNVNVISLGDGMYEVEIENFGGSGLTNYQIAITASELDGLVNDESLKIFFADSE